MLNESLITVLGSLVVAAPLALFGVLGVASLLSRPISERMTGRLVPTAVLVGLFSATAILILMLALGRSHVSVEIGQWVAIPGYHFSVKLIFDRLSLPFVILSFALCGVIGAFANRYMHREPGFPRFFIGFAMFLSGMAITSLAGTIETLFAGWELVGLSSAMLVAFFFSRPGPVRNGLYVWTVYRISDAALLTASVVMHHLRGEGDFDILLGTGSWPHSTASVTSQQAVVIGLLLLVAAAGKSALVPFSGWLPRAMEGPTPSSAIFYGALSVHLGAFLLLRISPLLDESYWLSAVVLLVGAATAIFAAFTERVQTDIKCALSFASLTQVGIIVAEIGIGLPRYIPLIHIIGHACLRTLQFLRAPSLLYDYRIMENAIGDRLPRMPGFWESRLPRSLSVWCYRLAMERGYLDGWLRDRIVDPFWAALCWCDRIERRWTDFLSGGNSRTSDRPNAGGESFEELL
ncbi:MAG TPA: proton-conducting transporter membrane subunit [Pirellulales bacterium]|nr:proton-conducting transporter membrane subunit [Pirellulales bacterium]